MLLRNRREPYNVVEESNQGLIDWYLMHDYEVTTAEYVDMPAILGETPPTLPSGKRGKNAPAMDKPLDDEDPSTGGD